jgi:hypothetical protein
MFIHFTYILIEVTIVYTQTNDYENNLNTAIAFVILW